jgi:hypothetical protein
MNEREFANKIKQDLNYGTGRLKSQVTDRLKQSRERAMETFATHAASESAYAFAGHPGHAHLPFTGSRKWLPLALIPLLLIGVIYWQHESNHEENIDAALLASDIPLNALVDKNFQAWLDQSSQR